MSAGDGDDRAEIWVLDPVALAVLDEIARQARLVGPGEARGRGWTA